MEEKLTGFYDLIGYLNKAEYNTTNDAVAMYLFENRARLKTKSLKAFAQDSYCSQASFTRFFQHFGLTGYSHFRDLMLEEKGILYNLTSRRITASSDPSAIMDDLIARQHACIDLLKEIPPERLVSVTRVLKEHQRIIFAGSNFSMAILDVLQSMLCNYADKNVYCPTSPIGQANLMKTLGKDDLVIFVSIKQRWYTSLHSKDTVSYMHASQARKMLWTCEPDHIDQELFDDVFIFGRNINQFSYTELMNLVPVLVNLYHVV